MIRNPEEHKRLATRLIEKILDGEISKEDQVKACGYMEQTFPDIGWRETEMEFIRMYRDEDAYNNLPDI